MKSQWFDNSSLRVRPSWYTNKVTVFWLNGPGVRTPCCGNVVTEDSFKLPCWVLLPRHFWGPRDAPLLLHKRLPTPCRLQNALYHQISQDDALQTLDKQVQNMLIDLKVSDKKQSFKKDLKLCFCQRHWSHSFYKNLSWELVEITSLLIHLN